MSPLHPSIEAIADHLEWYDHVLEVGIGTRSELARELRERALRVTAIDVHPRPVPAGVRFLQDDVFEPHLEYYETVDAVYALNLPPELHRPTWALARQLEASLCFTTLGAEQPEVPVRRVTIPGETLFVSFESGARDAARECQ